MTAGNNVILFYFNKDFQLHEVYPHTFGEHSATSWSVTFATEARMWFWCPVY